MTNFSVDDFEVSDRLDAGKSKGTSTGGVVSSILYTYWMFSKLE